MQSFAAVLKGLQVETMIRGFATSVSNYQPFGAPCSSGAFSIDGEGHVTLNCAGDACCDDPCNVLSGKNPANNESAAGSPRRSLGPWAPAGRRLAPSSL